ncbi:MAG: hypothetical protein GXY06_02385 [Clostridiaceae bacterium]|nr:hypothetical protein [Clostridiaceae bacterium]
MKCDSCGYEFIGTKICPSCGHGKPRPKPVLRTHTIAVSKNLSTPGQRALCDSCGHPLGASKVCPSCGHVGSTRSPYNVAVSDSSANSRQIILYDSLGYQLDADESAKASTLLHNCILMLFWLFIPSVISSVLSRIDSMLWLGTIISGVTSLAYAFVLFRLRKLDRYYDSAAKLHLCSSLLSILTIAILLMTLYNDLPGLFVLSLVLTLIVLIISILETYSEFTAHSNVSSNVSNHISTEWDQLWKWYIGLIIANTVVNILPIFTSAFKVIVLILAGIGSLVIGIIRLILLYRTAKLFR